ncbi:RNA pseudouridine synthase [Aliidongia dinghuensis]|uniref:RNA pseudouridine synthase n=1 Tax=Aliidongia dinghuensis TaxID=1867774 RepID=A0A8J3E1R8_9PROT|nr:RNA pseudouridine synthase [Aliidongia dinghuensis]GGF14511.1 RNA pseudouridine synthase [Aliidongia dinghuensis]
MTPDEITGRILWRSDEILVLDKPAGLAVHRAPGTWASLEDHFDALRLGLPDLPGLAHRLDKDTSGCLVLGRTPAMLRRLNQLFADGLVEKTYWAVVEGAPPAPDGRVDRALRRVRRAGDWTSVVDKNGQPAATRYRTLGSGDGRTWLELAPETGRTHQIRVHCAFLGCPVVGDMAYGRPAGPGERLHLHARAVAFDLDGARVEVVAPPPRHMLPALRACGFAV